MQIPTYVDNLLKKRTKLAVQLSEVSSDLDDWLKQNDIPLDKDYTMSGCMIYCEMEDIKENALKKIGISCKIIYMNILTLLIHSYILRAKI